MRNGASLGLVLVLMCGCSSPTPIADAGADVGAGNDAGRDTGGAPDAGPNDGGVDAPSVHDVGTDTSPDAFVSLCGNHAMDPGEVCDDGNTAGGDGCRADCRGVEVCGDGLADVGEYCPTHTALITALTGVFGGVALADGDADGDVDVFVLLDNHLQFFANAGDATFAAPHDTGAIEMGILVDVRGTAEPELVIQRVGAIDVLPNTAATFGAAITSTVPAVNLVPARVDADADTDFLVSDAATTCAPLLNDGAGHFTVGTSFDCGVEVRQILAGDVDGDGDDDAVFLHDTATDNVSIALGDGAAHFGARATISSAFPARGALGDVDRDGDLDLAHGVMVFPTRIEIVRTQGGIPQAPTHVPVTAFPAPPQLVDVDLDGDADLYNFGVSSGTPYAILRENDGTGDFSADLDTPVPNGASFFDMNGDGAIDLVTVSATQIQVFLAAP